MIRREIVPIDGGIEVALPTAERRLLASLPAQLRAVLRGEAGPPDAHERLFPRASEDPDVEASYRELAAEGLLEERLGAVEAFAETLEAGETRRATWEVTLDEEAAAAWLSATNDARLVLASLLGITSEEDWEAGPEPDDAASAALHYLSWLQEALLAALRGEPLLED